MIEMYLVALTVLIVLILYKLTNIPREAFLKLQRIDWWGLTYIPIISGYFLGGGKLVSVEFISLTALTFLWHGVVYAHNDLQDYYHDKDSEEARRPLQKYKDIYEDAVVFFNTYTLIVFITAFLFSLIVSQQDIKSVSVLFLAVILGHAYNDSSFGNYVPFGGVVAALYFSILPIWGYSLSSYALTSNNELIILSSIFFFLVAMYRITISGGLKDIDMENEINELKVFFKADYNEESNFYSSGYVPYYANVILLFEFAILASFSYLVLYQKITILSPIIVLILSSLLVFTYIIVYHNSKSMVKSQKWKWKDEKGYESGYRIEIIKHTAYAIVLLSIIGLVKSIVMMVTPVIFVMVMKKLLYGEDY